MKYLQPSLQRAVTDLHVSDGSNGKTFHFKVDTGACGNLLPYNLQTDCRTQGSDELSMSYH